MALDSEIDPKANVVLIFRNDVGGGFAVHLVVADLPTARPSEIREKIHELFATAIAAALAPPNPLLPGYLEETVPKLQKIELQFEALKGSDSVFMTLRIRDEWRPAFERTTKRLIQGHLDKRPSN